MALGGLGPTSGHEDCVLSPKRSPSGELEDPPKPAKCPRRRRQVIWQCVNSNCAVSQSEKLTRTADSFLTSFYGLKVDSKKKRKICSPCRTSALAAQASMAKRVQRGQSAFSEESRLPVPNDMVLLDDSDEELVLDSSEEESEVEVDLQDTDASLSQEQRLDQLLRSTIKSFNFSSQVSSCLSVLEKRLQSTEEHTKEIDLAYKNLETQINEIRNDFYADFRPKLKSLPSIEDLENVIENGNGALSPLEVVRSKAILPNVPPIGEVTKPPLVIGEHIYAMKGSVLNIWKEAVVIQVEGKAMGSNGNGVLSTNGATPPADFLYSVKFGNGSRNRPLQNKVLSAKQVTYHSPSKFRLPVGTRVVAEYQDDSQFYKKGEFFSGVIAEPPKATNKFRYLVFFDDGYASYVKHDNMRLVVSQTFPNVWEDVHSNSKEFIKQYLSHYPERAMVKLSVDQIVWTEWNGKWWSTKVIDVDASLVKLHFKDTKRFEWVYRGSTRLGPLFREMQQQKLKKEGLISLRRQNLSFGRKNTPYVEYTRQMDENNSSSNSNNGISNNNRGCINNSLEGASSQAKRAVARKSTASRKTDLEVSSSQAQSTKWESVGEIHKIKLPESKAPTRKYVSHTCGPDCILNENKYDEHVHMKKNSVLIIPILLGWERQITKHKNLVCRKVYYIAPCGRRLRNMDELLTYISTTGSTLEMDFFTFDWWVHVYNEFKISKVVCKIEDISYGKENVPISCVNSLDNNYPEYVEYSTKRLPQSGVNLNLDDDFLEGCDCEDDCRDKTKCSCWKLTMQSTDANVEHKVPPSNVGYVNRRLQEVVSTGIYECNSKCKCSKKCGNRVAQNPLRCKLQVFKTDKRGWGIRTLHDIPQGGFVCVYVGHLYDNEEANKRGQDFGDEYFAELDLIETVERRKDGYESDCGEEDEEDEVENGKSRKRRDGGSDYSGSNEDADSFQDDELEHIDDERDLTVKLKDVVPDFPKADRETRSLRRKEKEQPPESEEITVDEGDLSSDQNDKRGRAVMGFEASFIEDPPSKAKYVSTRKYFGKNEDVYIMDAKTIGNVGRYLNHSCNPNIFVQNCFVDTHDLRYPWIAFFASTFIRAGTELCWDYCYIVGQVEGKEIYCECGASNCRGRLL